MLLQQKQHNTKNMVKMNKYIPYIVLGIVIMGLSMFFYFLVNSCPVGADRLCNEEAMFECGKELRKCARINEDLMVCEVNTKECYDLQEEQGNCKKCKYKW